MPHAPPVRAIIGSALLNIHDAMAIPSYAISSTFGINADSDSDKAGSGIAIHSRLRVHGRGAPPPAGSADSPSVAVRACVCAAPPPPVYAVTTGRGDYSDGGVHGSGVAVPPFFAVSHVLPSWPPLATGSFTWLHPHVARSGLCFRENAR